MILKNIWKRRFLKLRGKHERIFVISSPPRCCSTAFARVFWEHAAIDYYCHEPFESLYYSGANLNDVRKNLLHPVGLRTAAETRVGVASGWLVVKEMPYQVGKYFDLLASLTMSPVVFLTRDPRLNIDSRIRKKNEAGQDPNFPLIETGWQLLAKQIHYCQEQNIPYMVVDASDLRSDPEEVIAEVFERLQLRFSPEVLTWQSRTDIELDNLGGQHKHLYERVLSSTGIQPESEPIPPVSSFPEANGVRDHVRQCRDIYKSLCADPNRVRPEASAVHIQGSRETGR